MSNRLLELQDEFEPPEVAPEVVIEEEEEEQSASLGYARLAPLGGRRRSRRVATSSASSRLVAGPVARSLAAARPISYRVPGSVPLVAAPGPMNAWSAAVTALLSWRERQVMGVDEALGRLGGRWLDLLHRNQGVPMAEKAALLAAAGLAGDARARCSADDFELLLRESGPLWITDDDRGARLFSRRAFIATGITGSHGRDAKLNVIDVMSGRGGAIKLSQLHRRMAGDGRRLQVLHLQQGAPNARGSTSFEQGVLDRLTGWVADKFKTKEELDAALKQGLERTATVFNAAKFATELGEVTDTSLKTAAAYGEVAGKFAEGAKNAGQIVQLKDNLLLLQEFLEALEAAEGVDLRRDGEQGAKTLFTLLAVGGKIGKKVFPPPFDAYFDFLAQMKNLENVARPWQPDRDGGPHSEQWEQVER